MRQLGRSLKQHEEPNELLLNGSGAWVVPDPANDTYYLVYDVSGTRTASDGYRSEPDAEGEYEVRFATTPTAGFENTRTAVREDPLTIVEHRVGTKGGDTVLAAPNGTRTVTVATTLPPGRNVTVRATDPNGTLVDRTVGRVVPAPGRWAAVDATLDVSGIDAGTKLTLDYRLDGSTLQERTVSLLVIEQNLSVTGATLSTHDATPVLSVDATLPVSGFVVVHASSPSGPVVGTSDRLSPSHVETVSIELSAEARAADRLVVVVYRDGAHRHYFDEFDPALPTNGSVVGETVSVPEDLGQPTTTRPTPTTGPTAPGGTTSDASTSSGVPGFDLVSSVVGAVALVLALVKRRDGST